MKKENTAIRLKKIMQERNLRQVDILNKTLPYCVKYDVKMNKSDISQYCSGKTEPNQDKLFVLGEALNVSEAWLMGYDVPMERTTSDRLRNPTEHCNNDSRKLYIFDLSESTLISEYRKMNNAGKDKLISTAREMNCSPLYNDNYQEELLAAHRRTDVEYSEEGMKHDLDIMSDENF